MNNRDGDREGRHQRFRHPPGLRGREIGLYYRNLAMKKRVEQNGEEHFRDLVNFGPNISIAPSIIQKVTTYLNTVQEKDEDIVSKEFSRHFEHLLTVKFEDFIRRSKREFRQIEYDDFNAILPKEKPLTESMLKRLQEREKLPAMLSRKNILRAVKQNQIVLIAGDTGCGKTTQVPQMILDDFLERNTTRNGYKIVCTQPRRISAISIAERVAYERSEKMGYSVGYQIRLDSYLPSSSFCIKYCTTGILLQQMQSDVLLNNLDVLILDEIHERSEETDLLMGLLKQVLPHRPHLRVILMSATVREEDFCVYFNNCFTFRIHGSLFPVKDLYLEDIIAETKYTNFEKDARNRRGRQVKSKMMKLDKYRRMISPYLNSIKDIYDKSVLDTIAKYPASEGCESLEFIEYLIFHICRNRPPGAILVFLPGYEQISKVFNMLKKPTQPIGHGLQDQIRVYALHSMMPTVQQREVFYPPPNGVRKIILSTSIAETSVTIDDVVYVINPGRTKRSIYDVKSNLQTLEEVWATKANNQQRKGRAGRVQPGVCFNLFTKAREERMEETPLPQILCSKLESIILNLKLLHIHDIVCFMNSLITPPDVLAIKNGIQLLKRIEALNDDEFITPLGMHLARLPIDPQTGKMILMAALFRCIDPITTVGAALSFKSPFYYPLGSEQKVDQIKKDLSRGSRSDHLLYHYVIQEYRSSIDDSKSREYCYENFLSSTTLEQLENMKQQFTRLLQNARFLESSNIIDPYANKNSSNRGILRAIIGAGLYPNISFLKKVRRIKNHAHALHTMSTPEDRRVQFHPSSVNSGVATFDSCYFMYFRKQKSSDVYLMDSSMIYPRALLIFGDKVSYNVSKEEISYISVGNAYNFRCDQSTADLVLLLRKRLEWLMQKKALSPSVIEKDSPEENIIKAIQMVLSIDEPDYEDVLNISEEEGSGCSSTGEYSDFSEFV